MVVVRWSIPAASLSAEGAEKLLAANGTVHKIFVNNADANLRVRREGDLLVAETTADAPDVNVKSHLRYMIPFLLGGKETSESA